MSEPKQPLFRARQLESVCVVDMEGRKANLDSVMSRGLPICTRQPERTGKLAIVASGPSVRDYLEELREWPGDIWAINGAYDYLLDNGIVPHGFFALDPLAGLAEYVSRPNKATTFYIATTCDPAVYDALDGFKIEPFHPADDDLPNEGSWVVGGGTTAVTRAPFFALMVGWRDITLYGVDSSYAGGEYCYEWGKYKLDIAHPKVLIEINGEGPFETEVGLMKQVSQLGVMHAKFKGRLKFKCGGLMDAFLRSPTMDPSVIEMDDGRSPSINAD